MTWFNLVSTDRRSCCDVLWVSARIFAFSDRIGRWAMNVYTCHLFDHRLRRHRMWNPRKSNPSLMCTTVVLAGDSRSPSGASTFATSSRNACTWSSLPCTRITKSSAYAEARVMPMLVSDRLVMAVDGVSP